MQTKLDRWLIEHFIYEYHIRLVSLPDKIPSGAKVYEQKKGEYQHLITIKNKAKSEKFIELLNAQGFTYKLLIVEGSHWYNNILNKKKSSFTFRMIWKVIILSSVVITLKNHHIITDSQLFIELKMTVIEILKSGK